MNLIEISDKFPNALDAVKYFEQFRWDKKPACPYFGSLNIGEQNKDLRWHCKDCFKSFSVTTNTKPFTIPDCLLNHSYMHSE